MKKLARTVMAALLVCPLFFACESMTGELEDVSAGPEVITTETGGGEGGGQTDPDGNPIGG